jgi:hypothetical protein
MKTFKDLDFKKHSVFDTGTQAKMILSDGTHISVINGDGAYSGDGTYEMMSGRIGTCDGIRGWLTPKQITRHMVYCQRNPLPSSLGKDFFKLLNPNL